MDSRDALDTPGTRKSLGLWDATSLIVGIIIGVGIFQMPPLVFKEVPQFLPSMLVWIAGGAITLLGALCFAELASTYPQSGGEYVYLSRAFGPPPLIGFLYAWTQLLLIRPGSIGAMAYVSAFHLAVLFGVSDPKVILALSIGAIIGLTVVNILGVRLGAFVQNLLTILKVIGLAAVIGIGLLFARPERVEWSGPIDFKPFAGAMVLVLWTYAGWNEAAYVASEVRNAPRNLTLSLLLGTAIVTVLYLLVNVAILFGLGSDGAASPNAAAQLVSLAWPRSVMSVIILVSALGALNGTIFTTARICVAFGGDHVFFAALARWHPGRNTPIVALVAEMAVSIVLVVGVFVPIIGKWGGEISDPFEGLVNITSAIFWLTFLLTGVTLFVLRIRDRDLPRHFKVPGYPVVPILFCLSCAYMVYASYDYAPVLTGIGFGILIAGVPIFYLSGGHRPRPRTLTRHELDEAIREDVTHGAASGL